MGRNKTDEKQRELPILGKHEGDLQKYHMMVQCSGLVEPAVLGQLPVCVTLTQETRVLLNVGSATITLLLASVLLH